MESKSHIATPPGASIREQIEDLGISPDEFARLMGLSKEYIYQLINGFVCLTPEVAKQLEIVLGPPASFWNRLEAIYQDKLAKVKNENLFNKERPA